MESLAVSIGTGTEIAVLCIFVSSNRLMIQSILLQLTEDDNFIGVRTVVPHVVYTPDLVLLLSSKQCRCISLCSELAEDDDLVWVVRVVPGGHGAGD